MSDSSPLDPAPMVDGPPPWPEVLGGYEAEDVEALSRILQAARILNLGVTVLGYDSYYEVWLWPNVDMAVQRFYGGSDAEAEPETGSQDTREPATPHA